MASLSVLFSSHVYAQTLSANDMQNIKTLQASVQDNNLSYQLNRCLRTLTSLSSEPNNGSLTFLNVMDSFLNEEKCLLKQISKIESNPVFI